MIVGVRGTAALTIELEVVPFAVEAPAMVPVMERTLVKETNVGTPSKRATLTLVNLIEWGDRTLRKRHDIRP